MERKAENITLYAQLGFLIYADGYTSKIASMRPSKNKEGEDVWEFVLDPSDELIKRYNLKPNINSTMVYTTQIKRELVTQLNPDPSWTRYFALVTYDGKNNPAIDFFKGVSQQKEIIELKKRLLKLKLIGEVNKEKLQLMETNLPKYMKRNVTPFIEELTPMLTKIMEKTKKDD